MRWGAFRFADFVAEQTEHGRVQSLSVLFSGVPDAGAVKNVPEHAVESTDFSRERRRVVFIGIFVDFRSGGSRTLHV